MTIGTDLIAAERQRQIEVEGYGLTHDAQEHANESLPFAAVAYALPARWHDGDKAWYDAERTVFWPWSEVSFKPTPNDRIRELVKAGALIAAEIDRLYTEQEAGR